MARNATYTDELKAQVVARYNEGAKVVDIAQEFGIPVSTVYEFRLQAGLGANRQRPAAERLMSIEYLLQRVVELERTIARLTAENTRLRAELAKAKGPQLRRRIK